MAATCEQWHNEVHTRRRTTEIGQTTDYRSPSRIGFGVRHYNRHDMLLFSLTSGAWRAPQPQQLLAARCPRLRLLNLDRLHQSRAKPLNFCQDSRTVQLNQDLLPLASLPLFLFLGLFLGLSGHPAIIGSYNAIRWSSSTQKRMGTHVLMIMIFRHRCARVVGQDAEWPRAQHAGIPHRADDAPAVHVKKELERARVDPLCVWPNPNQTM